MDEIVDYYTNHYREDLRFTTRAPNRLEWLRTNEVLAELFAAAGPGPRRRGRSRRLCA